MTQNTILLITMTTTNLEYSMHNVAYQYVL